MYPCWLPISVWCTKQIWNLNKSKKPYRLCDIQMSPEYKCLTRTSVSLGFPFRSHLDPFTYVWLWYRFSLCCLEAWEIKRKYILGFLSRFVIILHIDILLYHPTVKYSVCAFLRIHRQLSVVKAAKAKSRAPRNPRKCSHKIKATLP